MEGTHVKKHWGIYAGRVIMTIVLLGQAAALDYLLIYHNDTTHFAWIAGDILVIAGFVTTFALHRWAKSKDVTSGGLFVKFAKYPLGYVAWIIYSAVLVAKVVSIYKGDIPPKLEHGELFSPTMLKVAIGLTAAVFMFVVLIHHHPLQDSVRRNYIELLAYVISLDILDGVDHLDVITDEETLGKVSIHIYNAILAFTCINFIIPAIPLFILSRLRHGRIVQSFYMKFTHTIMHILAVNFAFLAIRVILWFSLGVPISVFIVKNLMILFMDGREVYGTCTEVREHKEEVEMQATDSRSERGGTYREANVESGKADVYSEENGKADVYSDTN